MNAWKRLHGPRIRERPAWLVRLLKARYLRGIEQRIASGELPEQARCMAASWAEFIR